MILTKEQRLEAYTFVYFALLAGKEGGRWFDGYECVFVCDWLFDWVEVNTKYNPFMFPYTYEFPEWYDLAPDTISVKVSPGWWPQDSPERIKAIIKCIAKCEQAKK